MLTWLRICALFIFHSDNIVSLSKQKNQRQPWKLRRNRKDGTVSLVLSGLRIKLTPEKNSLSPIYISAKKKSLTSNGFIGLYIRTLRLKTDLTLNQAGSTVEYRKNGNNKTTLLQSTTSNCVVHTCYKLFRNTL